MRVVENLIAAAKLICLGGRLDKEHIDEARDLAKKIANWFKKHSDDLHRYSKKNSQGWVFQCSRMGTDNDLFLILGPKSKVSGFGTKGPNGVVVLNILDERGIDNPYLDQWLSVGSKGTLIHELSHYLDFKRDKESGRENEKIDPNWLRDSEGLKKYINMPGEYDAFWKEAMSGVISMMENKRIRDHFMVNFKKFYAFSIKMFADGFLENLNAKNRRKIDKRLYLLYGKLEETLAKA